MEPFYKKFREAFRSSKYNQDAVLAKDLDVDPIYISTMRSGRRTPGRKIAAKKLPSNSILITNNYSDPLNTKKHLITSKRF